VHDHPGFRHRGVLDAGRQALGRLVQHHRQLRRRQQHRRVGPAVGKLTYLLTAAYDGSRNISTSDSPRKTLTVRK
jgi:hypothetical protein